MCIFSNMLEILHLWDNIKLELNEELSVYIKCNRNNSLNLKYLSIMGNSRKNIDLIGAYLVDADLSESYLTDVDFSGSDLREANLKNANLNKANFARTNLSGINFENVLLIGARLKEVELEKVEFRKSDLRGVDLRNIDTEKVDFVGTIFDEYQVSYLKKRRSGLLGTRVYDVQKNEIISYEEYVVKKAKNAINIFMKKA